MRDVHYVPAKGVKLYVCKDAEVHAVESDREFCACGKAQVRLMVRFSEPSAFPYEICDVCKDFTHLLEEVPTRGEA